MQIYHWVFISESCRNYRYIINTSNKSKLKWSLSETVGFHKTDEYDILLQKFRFSSFSISNPAKSIECDVISSRFIYWIFNLQSPKLRCINIKIFSSYHKQLSFKQVRMKTTAWLIRLPNLSNMSNLNHKSHFSYTTSYDMLKNIKKNKLITFRVFPADPFLWFVKCSSQYFAK